jgi:hypothetical protein
MRRYRTALRAAVVTSATTTVLAGCGGAGSLVSTPVGAQGGGSPSSVVGRSTSTAPPPPSPSEVTWVDGYCGVLVDIVKPSGHAPSGNEKHRAAFKKKATKYLETLSAGGRLAGADLARLGSAPNSAGEQAGKHLEHLLENYRKTVGSAQKTLKKAKPDKHKKFDHARKKIVKDFHELEDPKDPAKAIENSVELARAAASAPGCRELERLSGGELDLTEPGH